MRFAWFSELPKSPPKKPHYTDVLAAMASPMNEALRSGLGGCFAYNELVLRASTKAPFDHERLRARLFSDDRALDYTAQFAELKRNTDLLIGDACQRPARVSADVANLVELAVEKLLAGDASATAMVVELDPMYVATTAAKKLAKHSKIIADLAKIDVDSRRKRRALAQFSKASELAKNLYAPLANFCALNVWLRERIDDEHDDLKLYDDYAQRERELRFERLAAKNKGRSNSVASDPGTTNGGSGPPEGLRQVSPASRSRDRSESLSSTGSFFGEALFFDDRAVEDMGPIFID